MLATYRQVASKQEYVRKAALMEFSTTRLEAYSTVLLDKYTNGRLIEHQYNCKYVRRQYQKTTQHHRTNPASLQYTYLQYMR